MGLWNYFLLIFLWVNQFSFFICLFTVLLHLFQLNSFAEVAKLVHFSLRFVSSFMLLHDQDWLNDPNCTRIRLQFAPCLQDVCTQFFSLSLNCLTMGSFQKFLSFLEKPVVFLKNLYIN